MEQGSLDRQPAAPPRRPPPAQSDVPAAQAKGAQAQAADVAAPQGLEADVQAHLGRQLRAVYDEMASQPVPDRFIQLLDALERKGAKQVAASGDVAMAGAPKAGDA